MLIQLFLDYNGTERVAAFKINKQSQHLGAKKRAFAFVVGLMRVTDIGISRLIAIPGDL